MRIETGTGKAMPSVPQGRVRPADPVPNPIPESEAKIPAPKGHRVIASSLGEPNADVEAAPVPPRGQNTNASDIGALCGELMALQRDRTFAIRMQSGCDRRVEAYVRSRLGYRTDLSATERKRVSAEAKRIIKAAETGADHAVRADKASLVVPAAVSAVVLRNMVARGVWDDMRTETERAMRKLARELPGWPFVETVAGLSELGLAVIVGEAGNLADYPKKGHLWKRLGLAVIDGYRQGRVPPGLNPTERATAWIERGYSPHRRAEVFAFIDDVVLRHQWRAEKDGVPGHPIGPYGEHYARKKAEYIDREHPAPDKAARRYMAKMLIRDLHNAWRRAMESVPQGRLATAPATLPDAQREARATVPQGQLRRASAAQPDQEAA